MLVIILWFDKIHVQRAAGERHTYPKKGHTKPLKGILFSVAYELVAHILMNFVQRGTVFYSP